ncbi:MAG: hypothetical protein ABIH11_07630 [Candidatus Altiarchaeota archaeon]
MGIDDRGYIYTLITVGAILMIFSLVLFYFNTEERPINERVSRLTMDELYYFVESIKKDAERSTSIVAQRATTYAINHIIEHNENLNDYVMRNCSEFHYHINGSQAAIAELMYCGTFKGSRTGPARYMENHTMRDWILKVQNISQNMSYTADIRFRNLSIAPYDSLHFIVVGRWDMYVRDVHGRTFYSINNMPVFSVVPLDTLEDPSFHLHDGLPSMTRHINKCERPRIVNGSVMDSWINTGCYMPRENYVNAPSIFDRMEGRDTLSVKYVDQSHETAVELHYSPKGIAMESLLDLEELSSFGINVDYNKSQVDFMYWLDTPAYCTVSGMQHNRFRIDVQHAVDYGIEGLECTIIVTNETGVDVFMPAVMTVPVNTTIFWATPADERHLLSIIPDVWEGDVELLSSSTFSWKFTEPEVYRINCLSLDHGDAENRIVVLDV